MQSQEDMIFLILIAFLIFLMLVLYSFFSWRQSKHSVCLSPYTGMPLRRASDIHWSAKEKVLSYMYKKTDYANRMIDFNRSAYCIETGRIFPNCITWWGTIKVDWTFLQKHFPGDYVSWGSLSKEQQMAIREKHLSLEDYQTRFSSQNPSPRKVEKDYAFMKPGPLYADPETGILMGWKCVPETELEVLIVDRPVERYLPGVHKKY